MSRILTIAAKDLRLRIRDRSVLIIAFLAPLVLALNLTALNLGVALTAMIGGATVDAVSAKGIPMLALPFAAAALTLLMAAKPKARDNAPDAATASK